MSKECRSCGEENLDTSIECQNCGAELAPVNCNKKEPKQGWNIICPKCGKSYAVSDKNDRIMICEFCEDEFDKQAIATVNPSRKLDAETSINCTNSNISKLTIEEIRKNKIINILQDGIIGRDGDIEQTFFAADPYVSAIHCRVFYENGQWKIENLSHTNKTTVNGIDLVHNLPVVISNGDRLEIADMFFKVSVSEEESFTESKTASCDPNSTHTTEPEDDEVWEISCPVCGRKYIGEEESFRVLECVGTCSYDDFDKHEIAKELPRRIR